MFLHHVYTITLLKLMKNNTQPRGELHDEPYDFCVFDPSIAKERESSNALMRLIWGEGEFVKDSYAHWLYVLNPYGHARGVLVRSNSTELPAAQYMTAPSPAWIPGHGEVKALLSLNTATHPEHQRRGLFVKSAELTFSNAAKEGFSFVYGFPNVNSYPGFGRMGFSSMEQLQLMVRPIAPWALVAGGISVLRQWSAPSLIESRKEPSSSFTKSPPPAVPENTNLKGVIHIPRTPALLNWRYTQHPTRRYYFFNAEGSLAIVRFMEIGTISVALIMDCIGDLTPRFFKELWRTLRDDGTHVALGLFSPTLKALKPDCFRAFWLKVPTRFSPKPFYVITKNIRNEEPINSPTYFTLGDIDIY